MQQPSLNTWQDLGEIRVNRWVSLPGVSATDALRAVAGWKGVVIWDPEVNVVDLARALVEQAEKESCGQCFPCRLGTITFAAS